MSKADVVVVGMRPGIGQLPDTFHLGCGHTWAPSVRSGDWTACLAAYEEYRTLFSRGVASKPPSTVTCPQCQRLIDATKAEDAAGKAAQATLLVPPPQPARCNHVKPGVVLTPFFCPCGWDGKYAPRTEEGARGHKHGTCPQCHEAVQKRRFSSRLILCILPVHAYDPMVAFTYHRNGKHVW